MDIPEQNAADEHVGEPRLLICLYDDPLLHVDLEFLRLDELARRVEDPVVLWERDAALSGVLARTPATPPAVDAQWIEDRFGVRVHCVATKLGRGELFEVLSALGFLRERVLAPLHLASLGREPRGVRRLEEAPEFAATLRGTVAGHDARQCTEAMWRCVELYRGLRRGTAVVHRTGAERASVHYLAEVAARG